MNRRADRSRMTVRDRFETSDLVLPTPVIAAPQDRLLFIGSPLAEDGIVTRSVLLAGLESIAAASPLPLAYLPHPRENAASARAMVDAIANLEIAPFLTGSPPMWRCMAIAVSYRRLRRRCSTLAPSTAACSYRACSACNACTGR